MTSKRPFARHFLYVSAHRNHLGTYTLKKFFNALINFVRSVLSLSKETAARLPNKHIDSSIVMTGRTISANHRLTWKFLNEITLERTESLTRSKERVWNEKQAEYVWLAVSTN